MSDLLFLTNYSVAIAALIISVIGLIITLLMRYSDKTYRKYFLLIFGLLIAYAACNIVVWLMDGRVGYVYSVISYVVLFGESFFSSLLMPVLTLFLLFCAGKVWKKSPLFWTVAALWLIYFVLLVITQFTDWIYYYTADNVYHRGPFYALLLVPPALMMLANLVVLISLRDSLPKRYYPAFWVYILIPLVCMLIQMVFYGLLMTVLGSTISAFMMMIVMLMDQSEKLFKQMRENADLKVKALILQMRPHYIYNTMTSIYYLCAKDTKKAQRVINDFTSYLRKNFTALAKESSISFTEEMEHTRAYLAVEQARFEDRLFVDYDIKYTAFRLPPLTLQPIVENAVKHGLDPELEPLHISVKTREVPGGAELCVEDTGPGFNEGDNDEPHVALKNICERLEMMCKGKMEIEPSESGGTSVTVFIPDAIS